MTSFPALPVAPFIAQWRDNPLSERAGAQAFFLDLCALLGVAPPNDPDNYCFERGATRTGAGHGWADVWKRGHFGWENKGPGGDLGGALKQLMTYALALDNPPLLVVSNRAVTQIHTHFTGTPSETHTIRLEEIGTPENLQKLRWLFTDPEKFRPGRTVLDITADAAGRFADIAQSMTGRGHPAQTVAHYLIQCLFCMFAEDIGLLPAHLFERILSKRGGDSVKLSAALGELFRAMQTGGDFLLEDIAWFNGGLFAEVEAIELTPDEIAALHSASKMDWSAIEPAILGTLFERGLDPKIRAPLGANYTDPGTILKLVTPVIVEPLAQEWAATRDRIGPLLVKYHAGGKGAQSAYKDAQSLFLGHLERLKNFRVLDPACGSGNFLYLSLRALKDLEHRANLDAEALGLHRQLSIETSPANVLGIEINRYAAELARVTVWIGEIQWMLKNGYDCRRNPILATLDHIEHRDALLNGDGSEAEWPSADVIVGNPPFLGDKMMRGELGDPYVERLRKCYAGRVPGGADLVTYWFEKGRAQIEAGLCKSAGLVATNSIRGGASRKVLERIVDTARIFEAWSDEAWVNEGAAVRVSLVCFSHPQPVGWVSPQGDTQHSEPQNAPNVGLRDKTANPTYKTAHGMTARLDGQAVVAIHADLTGGADNLTQAKSLPENANTAYLGIQKTGPFDLPGELGRSWLNQPNPNGRPNCEIVKPWFNGLDITRRNRDMWIVDFGTEMPENEACLYELPFAYAKEHVQPTRFGKREARTNEMWWLFQWSRPLMRKAIKHLPRLIVTPETPTHTVFAWMPSSVVADKNLIVIARADEATFGTLCSRFHSTWVRALGSPYGNHPTARRYNSSAVFETFPFPVGLTPRDTAQSAPTGPLADNIARAAQRLNELRENWLNPVEWVDWVITQEEEQAGFPKRPVAKPGHEADLKKRTLTHLYNARPAWLEMAHRELDQAVATAYGWSDYTPALPDEEILRRLLALNLARSAAASAP